MSGAHSKNFRPSPRSIRPVYTGGPVLLTKDGQWIITTMGDEALVTQVHTGLAIARIRGDGTPITSLALSYHTFPPTLLTSHMSMTVRYYPLPESPPPTSTPKPPSLTYTRILNKAHSAPILVSQVSPDNTLFATGSSDGIVKVWDLAGGYVTHLFRGHGGPVSALHFNFPTILGDERRRMELLTGSTDARVRIYDLRDANARVVGGAGGNAVKPKAVLEGHVSVVRGIDVTPDGKWAVTGGRDKVVLVWDMLGETKGKGKAATTTTTTTTTPKLVQTIIVQEQVESLGLLPQEEQVSGAATGRWLCYTGGDKGLVRVWDVLKGTLVATMKGVEGVDEAESDEDEQRGVLSVLYSPTASSLVSIHADQNIIFHSLSTLLSTRQIIGFNDEIVDVAFLSHPAAPPTSPSPLPETPDIPHSHMAVATNSNLLRIYSTSSFNARLLPGHTDMILSLAVSPNHQWLVTGSKDHTARVWAPTTCAQGDGYTWRCIAVCEGHAESIGAVAFAQKVSEDGHARFLFTASQDRTIKMWDLTPLSASPSSSSSPIRPRSMATLRAHEKDINSLDIAPNDKFLVSGSQDKLVKLYAIDFNPPKNVSASGGAGGGAEGGFKLLGTCAGHRRGVWTVRFSRNDKVVASGSADRTVKLWSLDDFTCLKTFEGHTNSVLRVDFLSHGQQLVTSASDGLVKLWNIKEEECVKTLDNHEDKIWALAHSSDESTLLSAGADSLLTIWHDTSLLEQSEANANLIKTVQVEQDFINYVALKDYRRAILLALSMSQPGRLFNLFSTVVKGRRRQPDLSQEQQTITGSKEIDEIIKTLPGIELVRLLKFVRDWNANAKMAPVAQVVLHAVFMLRSAEDILAAFDQANRLPKREEEEEGEEEEEEEKEEGENKKRQKKERPSLGAPISIKDLLEGLIPYSERHFNRVDKLVQESYMLDYVLGEMEGGLFGEELMDIQ
ncbi:U3 small nucleolar RNA-associated protein 13 (U3 snoRNA-associated protein 13) [Cryptococcus gattii WM276]|uniref:U3 small nucleolar RNA-associated protein 13 (U3 snoRNA-associated protein 13) n=1 Tax=Cryptococcus gattii serotype B (strain WM276 / ATCC MYA-4071) TaxID=367775 RepID=E6R278_CRYGW|nr:U3 small nucleolar RNA-associated protein 13 (U3 snoRNA-associated protein 13) [Cryptococcus gattii WM276]ADV21299.1 U3 small nucleolar RNA-associated protein 13 (U3 snoRNA-associated protein 13) [Cryptococcus gattii WM276]